MSARRHGEGYGQPGRRNVLFFLTDGHRTDAVGCYGGRSARTPAMDRLAAGGVRCDAAFAAEAVCMPTRASLFTGRYPHIHGVWANGVPLRRSETTLADVLSAAGYAACACGKIHFEPQQDESYAGRVGTPYYGFGEVRLHENKMGAEYREFLERSFPGTDYAARRDGEHLSLDTTPIPEEAHEVKWVADRAIEFIERSASGSRPFFCFCSFHELIPPCTPPVEFASLVGPADVSLPERRPGDLEAKPEWYRRCHEGSLARGRYPDDGTLRRYLATYHSQAAFLDRQLGRLLDALDGLGLRENTIVVFSSDHGLMLGEHGLWRHGPFLYDPVIRVPLVWRGPGFPAGRVDRGLIESVDIMPTLLDALGVAVPPGVQGISHRARLSGADAPGRASIMAQTRESPDLLVRGIDPAGFRSKCLRTAEWKLILHPGTRDGELYDLVLDPGEFVNLYHEPRRASVRREMEGRLLERLALAEDPLPVRLYAW